MHVKGVKQLTRRASGEHGSYLILFALLLVGLVSMIAIVVDIAQQRASGSIDQSVADFAAIAGGNDLSLGNYLAACEDMVNYINTNAGLGSSITPSTFCTQSPPGDVTQTTCSGGTESQATPSQVVGNYTVSIHFPVPPDEIKDTAAFQNPGVNDGAPCERMRVIIKSTDHTILGGVANISSLPATRSATIVGFQTPSFTRIPALLTLERTDCNVISTSGQGAIFVKGAAPSAPGVIHADSYGNTSTNGVSECTSNNNANGFVVYGTSIPSGGWLPGAPSIISQGPSSTVCPNTVSAAYPSGINEGLLDLVAAGTGHDAYIVPTGVCPGPAATAAVASRKLVDDRWNGSGNGNAVDNLRTSTNALLADSNATLAGMGYEVYPDKVKYPGSTCKNDGPQVVTDNLVVVDCPSYSVQNKAAVTFSGTEVLFRGDVSVPSGATLTVTGSALTNTQVVIAGSNKNALSVQGTFNLNLTSGASCTALTGPTAKGGTYFPYATLVMQDGPLANGGTMHLCQTFAYMSSQGAQEITSDTPATVEGPTCSTPLPCPIDPKSNNNQSLTIDAGSSTDWTAPNQCDCVPTSTFPFEGMAFWTESGEAAPTDSINSSPPNSSITANANGNVTQGDFFMPNALFTFTGGSTLNQVYAAQFISRRLNMDGQGVLTMQPNPNTSVPIPTPSYQLIR